MAKQTNSTSSIVVVPFRTDQLITIQREDGIYVAIRPICERCGIDWSSQLQRIKRHPILAEAVVMTTTPFTRHGQEEACLRLDYLNGWLMGIDSKPGQGGGPRRRHRVSQAIDNLKTGEN